MLVPNSIVVSETEFSALVASALADEPTPDFIVGPGRSGAVAAVYASYRMHRPFVPYGHPGGPKGSTVLIVDTVSMTGGTIRKARAKYERMGFVVRTLTIVPENQKRHHFWFEYADGHPVRQEA
jgi:adenine/guanine phosphoribosyltransferase-like PRPP-binding protein